MAIHSRPLRLPSPGCLLGGEPRLRGPLGPLGPRALPPAWRCGSLLASGLLALLLACAPPPPEATAVGQSEFLDPAQYLAAQAMARAQLQQLYGPELRLRTDPQLGTVAFLQGPALPLPAESSLTAALSSFVLTYRSLYGVLSEDDLRSAGSGVDAQGMTHVRLIQLQDGVPIWGSVLVGHLDKQGLLVRLHARLFGLHLGPSAPSTPTLKPEDARQQAVALLRAEEPALSLTAGSPSLYYLFEGSRRSLVYRVEVHGQRSDEPVRLALFIDAHRGELVRREDRVARVDVTVPAIGHGVGVLGDRRELALSQRGKTYSLQDPKRGKLRTTTIRSGEQLPGKTVTSKDPEAWPDAGQAVDVHAHLQALWDYFATEHQRFGWDGKGSGIVAVTHLGVQAPLALFDGERLLFGDGDGKVLLPVGAALDVVAHEYGHALARSTADLASTGESGALDEGLADLWGCLLEQALEPRHADWTLGERIFVANQVPGPKVVLRDLVAPQRSGQAQSLAEYQAGPDEPTAAARSLLVRDAQHHNAGIAAHAGYLLAQRVGIGPTAAIVYRALTTYLHRYAGFADAMDAMQAAALDLYDQGPQAAATAASWTEVGVSGLAP